MCDIRLQASKLARKCEIKHWYACGADRQSVGVLSHDWHFFLRWIDLLSYGATLARSSHARGAPL